MKSNEYAIRCFLNKKRIKSHQLTKRQARMFRKTAIHLAEYLTGAYNLGVHKWN